MLSFAMRRIAQSFVVLIVMSLLVFLAVYALGNPVATLINPASPQEVIDQAVRDLGLDQPLHIQYWHFLQGAFQGDLGRSYSSARPALQMILERFPATLELTTSAMIIATAIGIPAGLIAGYRPNSFAGRTIGAFSIVGISLPTFWIGLMMIVVLAIQTGWFPTGGRGDTAVVFGIETSLATWDGLHHLVLPALNLALFPMAMIARLTRAGVQENIRSNYILFARAKGLRPSRIIIVYLFKSVLIPIVTVMGILFGILLAFGVVTETVFAWPGIGKLIIESIRNSDRPVVIAYLLFTVVIFTLINLIVDLICAAIDPRLSIAEAK